MNISPFKAISILYVQCLLIRNSQTLQKQLWFLPQQGYRYVVSSVCNGHPKVTPCVGMQLLMGHLLYPTEFEAPKVFL